MSGPVVTALIAGVVALLVGIVSPFLLVNLNRASAVKLLTEAAEKTGIENQRLNEKLIASRSWVIRLVNEIYRFLPAGSLDNWQAKELRDLADQARINL